MSPFDPDDPRLTAYALGEASETDRQAVEKLLAASPEARAEIEEVRKFAQLLTSAYAAEQTAYLESRSDDDSPRNVITLPPRSRLWQHAVGLGLKAAAVAAVLGCLGYETLQKTRLPRSTAVGSAAPNVPPEISTPAPPGSEPTAASGALAQREISSDALSQTAAADQPTAGAPAAPPAPLLAEADEAPAPAADETRTSAATARASAKEMSDPRTMNDRVAPALRPAGSLSASQGAATTAVAAAQPPAPSSTESRLTASLVRIRTATGKYFGGVILTADGFILCHAPLSDNELGEPCTVFLSDKSDFPAVAHRLQNAAGLGRLRIDRTGLSPVKFADHAPAGGSQMIVTFVDQKTGTTKFLQIRAASSGTTGNPVVVASAERSGAFDGAAFVFNPSGELLAVSSSLPEAGSQEILGRSAVGTPSAMTLVRPFTPTERSAIRKVIETKDSQ